MFSQGLPAVLAFDPGGTTGVFYDGPRAGKRVQEFIHIEGDDHHTALWDLLTRYTAYAGGAGVKLVIICEKFEFRKEERDFIEYIPKEYEGVIKLFAFLNQRNAHDIKLVSQGASYTVGKTAFWGDGPEGNKKIKFLGMWHPKKKHALDAFRHYLYWVSFTLRDNQFLHRLKVEDQPLKENGIFTNKSQPPKATGITFRGVKIR
jgi:hypothetical protein